jgi:hypothetical protein
MGLLLDHAAELGGQRQRQGAHALDERVLDEREVVEDGADGLARHAVLAGLVEAHRDVAEVAVLHGRLPEVVELHGGDERLPTRVGLGLLDATGSCTHPSAGCADIENHDSCSRSTAGSTPATPCGS